MFPEMLNASEPDLVLAPTSQILNLESNIGGRR